MIEGEVEVLLSSASGGTSESERKKKGNRISGRIDNSSCD